MTPSEAETADYAVQDLSPTTWLDFETLFNRYGGVQAGCWCMFYRREHPPSEPLGPARTARNRADQRFEVMAGRSHGVLVYWRGRAVGWCQYGLREALPRIERGRIYRNVSKTLGGPPTWRITCFFVDREHRRRGVAQIALRGAIEAIRRQGGGVVEAYPSTHARAVAIWFGTTSMFEREGFRRASALGRSNVIMRRTLRAGSAPASVTGRRKGHRPSAALTKRRGR